MSTLTDAEVQSFRGDGYHFPIDVLDEDAARESLAAFRRYDEIAQRAGGFISVHRHFPKLHLLTRWADDLVRNERILDAVESVLGPDLLVWGTQVFMRPARSGASLAWHQDAVYYGFRDVSERAVRVWVSLTPATVANGTMRYARGSHLDGLLEHGVRGEGAASVMRGEEILVAIDPDREVVVEIEAGQASVHDLSLAHCSGANVTGSDRLNLAIDYLTPDVQPTGEDSALLVRGEDVHGHFAAESALAADFDTEALGECFRATRLRTRRLQSVLRAARA